MASGRIKGITIQIGGDTQGLEKALSSVNKNIKSTQSELKDVERLLKIDPTNTELLAQKQRLLAQTIGETKEKLWALKEASTQANEALERGEISQSQYDALQREIVETENTLKELEEQAGRTENALGKLPQTGEKFKDVGSKVEDAGKKIMPVSVVVGGLGAVSIKTAADFDSAMSQVAAVSGATGDELEQLRDKAREMGAKTKFSASEAAEAMNYMAMAGWKTSDMLSGLDGIMNLAAASGEDLATTSDIVTDALTAFGLTAEDSGHFADMLAAASSNANTNVGMMGETFKYCAPVAGALGFTAEDTAEAIGLMANSGIKSSQAGTAMRSMMTSLAGEVTLTGREIGNLTIQTKESDGSMKSLGQILKECRFAFSQMSESEQEANAEALVGKNAMSGFLAIMNAAPSDIEKLRGAIDNCDGAAENMATIMQDNLNGQITTLKSKLSELAIAFGEILMPAIRAAADIVGKFIDWLNGLSPVMKTIVAVIGVIVAALGPVLVVAGKIIFSIGQVMTIIPKLSEAFTAVKTAITVVTTAVKAFSTALLANPIGLVIAAIAALVAAFIYFWNTSEEFRQFWIDLWEGIKTIVSTAVEAIKDFFAGIADFFQNNWQGILMFIANPFAGAFKLIWDNCEEFRQFWIELWEGIKTTIEAVWNGVKDFLGPVWNQIKEIASATWELIKNAVLGPVLLLIDLVTGDFEALKSDAQKIWQNIKDAASAIWTGLKELVVSIVKGFVDKVVQFISDMPKKIKDLWEKVKQNAVEAWENIKNKVQETVKNLKDTAVQAFKDLVTGIKDALANLGEKVEEGFQAAIDFITSLPDKAIEWGKDFIEGLKEGIKQKIKDIVDSVKEVAEKIKELLHFSRPDKGPLRDYEKWMPDFMKGLADGIRNNQGLVTDAVNGLAENMSIRGNVSFEGQANGQGLNAAGISEMLQVMKQYLPYLAENKEVVLDTGATIGALAPKMNMEFRKLDVRERGR